MSVWLGGLLAVGHRGGRGEGWPPENTLEAFERACAQGASAIELDVRPCATGEVVVLHDRDLLRMTRSQDRRAIAEVPLAGLRAIDLGAGVRIPMLADVLAWARDRDVAVNVELKHDVPSRVVAARAVARVTRAGAADVLFSSFDPLLLAMIAALAPSTPRALLTHAGQPRWADVVEACMRPGLVSAIHLERAQLDARSALRCRRRRLRIGVWTVNDPDDAREVVSLGARSIISDEPGLVRAVIDRR